MLKVVAKNYADPKHLDEALKLCRELVEITRESPAASATECIRIRSTPNC
jgi:quinol monooxygenase YgiN